MTPFKPLEKGGTPTFLQTAFANRVLNLLNGLIAARVMPAGAGKFVVTDGGIVLDLTPMQAAAQAQQIADLTKALAQTQGQLAAVIKSLKSAQITCSGGNVVLVLTKLP